MLRYNKWSQLVYIRINTSPKFVLNLGNLDISQAYLIAMVLEVSFGDIKFNNLFNSTVEPSRSSVTDRSATELGVRRGL